jgi:predicted esterase
MRIHRPAGNHNNGTLNKMMAIARRTACVLFILPLLVIAASAQDAAQVLRLSVGYNTLKNSTPLKPEQATEVDRLAKLAQAAAGARNYGEALKDYYHAMTVIRGGQWTPSTALGFSLAVELKTALPEQNSKDEIILKSIYKLDEPVDGSITGTLSLVKLSGDNVAQLGTFDNLGSDLNSHPGALTFTLPEVPDGNYKLHVALKPGSGEETKKDIDVHVQRGLALRVQAAQEAIDALRPRLGSQTASRSVLDALASAEYHVELYNLASRASLNFTHIDFDKEINEATQDLAELNLGRDPYAARHGDFRRAYLSTVDNSLQPYRVYVPAAYDGKKPFPLVIALHGMGGDENSYFDQYANGAFKTEAEQHGYIVACPKGRGPAAMYQGDAEKDVLDVLAAVERDYSIDHGRVYLTGHSMGGFGTWSVALAHPEIFTAIAPISGGGNPSRLSLISRIPALVVHGDNDKTVSVESSRVMVAAGKKAGEEIKYIEVPGGSHVSVAALTFKDVFEWFDSHPKRSSAPAESAGRQ